MLTRRRILTATAGAAGVAALGLAGWEVAPYDLKVALGVTPDPFIPSAAEGEVRLDRLDSTAMGTAVDLFTAVPAGHGDGAGLPVVVVLHGSSARARDLRGFGLGRFLTAAVEAGAPPFVLAGTDDGPDGWVPSGSVDPRAMLTEELPGWLTDRGFDARRRSVWGWSRGGYGALRLVLEHPDFARAAALFSPALSAQDPALDDLGPLDRLPVGLWCGNRDPFIVGTRALAEGLPTPPEVLTVADGGHTRVFWNAHTLDALGWLAGKL